MFNFKKYKLICISTAAAFLSIFVMFTLKYNSRMHLNNLIEIEKCPLCFGVGACYLINNIELIVNYYSADLSILLSNFFGVKNVYYGKMGKETVVLKKLAASSEFKIFNDNYDYSDYNNLSDEECLDMIKRELNTDWSDPHIKLRICPTVEHINLLFNNALIIEETSLINLWTMIKINPEPLILKFLSVDNGWPVPHFYGSCGRLIIEEYVGPTLGNYYQAEWFQRAEIASNLLDAAKMFTFRDANFSYYLTDISLDNIAVNSDNVVKFIDLENIIVVDKIISEQGHPETWHKVHKSDGSFKCSSCYIFSPSDICNHEISDHNYYSICKHILAQIIDKTQVLKGFLHDIPFIIQKNYPNLMNLMKECAEPNSDRDRITAGNKLSAILKSIIKMRDL